LFRKSTRPNSNPSRYTETGGQSHSPATPNGRTTERPAQHNLPPPSRDHESGSSHSISIGNKSPARNFSNSATSSADGSPPNRIMRSASNHGNAYRQSPTSHPASLIPAVPQRPVPRQPSSTRLASASGGLQVVLGETSSWSDLAKQDTTLPADAKDLQAKPNGMLGFWSRKKGRGHSPKPQERGILGKEGARVVLSSG
jgi:serine/threonine kinase 32